ncbi:hypothetical protein Salat_0032800 [Sesamum alatum]|uniref:Uncharacterized protein n=1 Tax=Sesamum alatum TaxID=300844 RepID=A0AAE1YVC4_9LAMI|nr:hypothetical protein Salat_0032800 [Sesamum alatum]
MSHINESIESLVSRIKDGLKVLAIFVKESIEWLVFHVKDGLKVLANFVKEFIEWLKRFFHIFSSSWKESLVKLNACFEKISKPSTSKWLCRDFHVLMELVMDIVNELKNLDWCDGGFWDCMSEAAAKVKHTLWEKMNDDPVQFLLQLECLCQILMLFCAF